MSLFRNKADTSKIQTSKNTTFFHYSKSYMIYQVVQFPMTFRFQDHGFTIDALVRS